VAKLVSQPTPNVATSGGQPQPAASTPFRTNQAAQFDVDWRDFLWGVVKPTKEWEVHYPQFPAGKERTMQSGPMSGEDIFSDRRNEGRRTHGR
jgi:hypothetical protein